MASLRNSTLLFFIAVLLSACGSEPPPTEGPIVRPVKILTVGTGASGRFEFPGAISSAQQAEMAFEVAGRLVELPIKEGQNVNKGDLLAKLDQRDFITAVESARARATNTRQRYDRVMQLVTEGVASQQEGDDVKRDLDVATADLATARKALGDSELRAPFSGQVAVVHVDNFQQIQPWNEILDLLDINSLEIHIDVPENLIVAGRTGLTVEERAETLDAVVTVSGIAGREFPARLREIAQRADPTTRTYRAKFSFERPTDANLLPGMTARLIVMVDTGDSGPVQIPTASVTATETGQSIVWRVNDDMTVSSQEIELGPMAGDAIAVVSGLESGDRIAITGVHLLRDGMQIRELVK
ncbi:MAG: efflux RND transporter periplasmic adaptor subunit [Gammaproteobacteria bacterium]